MKGVFYFMTFTYSYKDVRQSKRLVSEIERTLSRLEKYFSTEPNCLVHIFRENNDDSQAGIKVTLSSGKKIYRTEQITENHYKTINLVYDKLKAQVGKQ
jgi:ribosomal subunit interface protein